MPDSYQVREEARQLVKQEDGARGIVVGTDVYEALNFVDDIASRVIRFTARQYLFLKHYKLGISLEAAAEKAGLTPDAATHFLDKPDTRAWLQDRAMQDHIKNEWAEPSKWWSEGHDVWEGKKAINKNQMEVWREFGKRVCPMSEHGPAQTKIEINIDPEAIERSKVRRKAIEAQIVLESKDAV